MEKRYRTIPFVLTALFLFALPVAAQEDYAGSIDVSVACLGNSRAELTIHHYVPEVIPERYVGWIVVRRVVGKCVDDVQVGPVRDFPPAGPGDVVIQDVLTESGHNVLYFVFAVTDTGDTEYLPWPRRAHFKWADCAGGPSARGVVEIWGEPPYDHAFLQVCPDECWYDLSYLDQAYPPEWMDLDGTFIEVYGEIKSGMEGNYIVIDSWRESPVPCFEVPAENGTWDSFKARYR